MGMAILASAHDIITLFVGLELLSIPLYILCAAEYRREGSLESGLKYLIIGSVGSATLVYGLAMIYGATGQTGFSADRRSPDQQQPPVRSADARGYRPDRGRPRVQGVRGAVPPVDPGCLRGCADPNHVVHGDRHQGGGARHLPALL